MDHASFSKSFRRLYDHVVDRDNRICDLPVIADTTAIEAAVNAMPEQLPETGMPLDDVTTHLLEAICPGLAPAQAGPRYFGFVTGGVTPASFLADVLVSSYDPNVQVHLPRDSVATMVEARALSFVLGLLRLPRDRFLGRTFTTGATAANLLGLCVGREAVVSQILSGWSVAADGFPPIDRQLFGGVKILHADAHASIGKAAAIVGIGRRSGCHNVSANEGGAAFNLDKLAQELIDAQANRVGCIVVASCGEVNTGESTPQLPAVRSLCDKYSAWLHIDAAFGAFAASSEDLCLADSITTDAHKWLNVPYDCGIFFTRSAEALQTVFSPALGDSKPAYLSSGSESSIPSPLTVGIENSRRFRALPVYASLLSLGRSGYQEVFTRNISFARRVAKWINESAFYELLNAQSEDSVAMNIVLFAASERAPTHFQSAAALTAAINASRRVYVTASVWRGRSAVRLAVSNWRTGMRYEATGGTMESDLDFVAVTEVLSAVMLQETKQTD